MTGAVDSRYKTLPLCSDRLMKDSPMSTLQRTSRAVPALTAVFTLAAAFHKAWESKCQQRAGICPALREMLRKEFVARFLEPVEFLVGRDGGGDGSGRRSPREAEGRLQGSKLSLTRYLYEEGRDVTFEQVSYRDSFLNIFAAAHAPGRDRL